jgi:pyrroline-5-carboxylate reductase
MKLGIIGCGNMGLTYAKSFLKYDLVTSENLYLFEKSKETLEHLGFGVPSLLADNNDVFTSLDIIILAIKPQNFLDLATDLRTVLNKNSVIISIMAGITLSKLMNSLNHSFVIRAMPNMPTQIGQGMTAFTASDNITIGQLRKVEKLFNTTGRSIFVDDENQLNPITALSGSGPAYIFYFLKSMIRAGTRMGLKESDSLLLSRQTFQGALQLYNGSTKSLDELISMVRSEGGTTDAALNFFDKNEVSDKIIEGILMANKRAKELNL